MAMTPLPDNNDNYENPSILVSEDGSTWSVPVGLTNPVVPELVGGNNSDPELVMIGSTLWMIYRATAGGLGEKLWAVTSSDGVTWSERVFVLEGFETSLLSPSIVFDGSQYIMIVADGVQYKLWRRTAPALTGPWSGPVECGLLGLQHWHQGILADGNILHGVFYQLQGSEYYATSSDWGATWQVKKPALMNPTNGWDKQLYRASLVKTASGFDMWYGANDGASPVNWHIGKTSFTA